MQPAVRYLTTTCVPVCLPAPSDPIWPAWWRCWKLREATSQRHFSQCCERLAETLPRRGLVVVLSDLLGDRNGMFAGMQFLQKRGHDLVLLHVLDDDEINFPFEGPTRFEGLELPEHIACNPRSLRAGYLAAMDDFLAEVR